MQTFGQSTLNDNWFEERAPPLKGVLADYGARCYDTTSLRSFPQPRVAPHETRASMYKQRIEASGGHNVLAVTQRSTCRIAQDLNELKPPDWGFDSRKPRPEPDARTPVPIQ